jgi:hypothetical protein
MSMLLSSILNADISSAGSSRLARGIFAGIGGGPAIEFLIAPPLP